MSYIYISPETYKKMGKSSIDENTAFLLKKFSPKRKESKKSKNTQKDITGVTNEKLKTPCHITRTVKNDKNSIDPKRVRATLRRNRSRIRRTHKALKAIELERKKLKKVQVHSRKARSTSVSPWLIGVSSSRATQRRTCAIKEKPLYDNRGKDMHDYAGMNMARTVEYGHGRQKTKEWNDNSDKTIKRDLSYLRDLKKRDPNLFDRGAIK